MTAKDFESDFTYSLVKETFPSDKARELLMNLLAGTARFHSLDSLHSYEKKGIQNEPSERKIDELHALRETILEMLKENSGEEVSVEINTVITISPAEKES